MPDVLGVSIYSDYLEFRIPNLLISFKLNGFGLVFALEISPVVVAHPDATVLLTAMLADADEVGDVEVVDVALAADDVHEFVVINKMLLLLSKVEDDDE